MWMGDVGDVLERIKPDTPAMKDALQDAPLPRLDRVDAAEMNLFSVIEEEKPLLEVDYPLRRADNDRGVGAEESVEESVKSTEDDDETEKENHLRDDREIWCSEAGKRKQQQSDDEDKETNRNGRRVPKPMLPPDEDKPFIRNRFNRRWSIVHHKSMRKPRILSSTNPPT